ncbi:MULTISPECIES: hypothetical protein [Hyphomicrobium]|uniref:Uncharacterized protein n=1 Tax=Hyphomicrobium sulfonivorans TaxID=121290 RepID=A0A109BDI1_HYPSL|nr:MULTISPECIES: hypothetical protein [Hyphomicrobium]KWT66771.1 hypothetical protein APY04_2178 [Hyphomicrobium sulfonivorans]MDH4981578.1 hypothetical protein [Hyphomicrobium sp. D-2]
MSGGRIVVALALATAVLAGHSAFAFQQEQVGAPAATESAPAAPVETAPAADPQASLNTDIGAKAETGTEIRIPGLGRLGVLPKMDFGLELLYGAAESQPDRVAPPEDDLTVRGSVKHRF